MRAALDPEYAKRMIAAARDRHPNDYYSEPSLIHVSELIRCLRQSYYRRVVGVPTSEMPSEDLTLMLGSAFGAWLEPEEEEVLRWNGIKARVDITVHEEDGIPNELKSTRSSASKPLTGKDGMGDYLDQVFAYAVMKGKLKARLNILHIMGNYKDNRQPILHSWKLEITEEEAEAHRRRMLERRDILQAALDTGTPPDTSHRLRWACGYCPFFKTICYPQDRPAWGSNFTTEEDPETGGLDEYIETITTG